jgi:hypothetical protein
MVQPAEVGTLRTYQVEPVTWDEVRWSGWDRVLQTSCFTPLDGRTPRTQISVREGCISGRALEVRVQAGRVSIEA